MELYPETNYTKCFTDKGIQSAGAAGVWRADGVELPYVDLRTLAARFIGLIVASYMQIFISTWILLAAGLIFSLPMILIRVNEKTEEADIIA